MVPCVRFELFVRLFLFLLLSVSYKFATLGTGGWLDLTRRALAARKKRQASLGAQRLGHQGRALKHLGTFDESKRFSGTAIDRYGVRGP